MIIQYNKFVVVGIAVGLTTLLTACDWLGKRAHQEEHSSLVLVNVLDENYYKDCHIDTDFEKTSVPSINVPFAEIEKYALAHWDKETTEIVIYCANYKCTASAEGAKMLKNLGFKHVWAYEGGTAEWKQLGYPVKGDCQQSYLNDANPVPQEHPAETPSVTIIKAQELKQKIEEHSSKKCC